MRGESEKMSVIYSFMDNEVYSADDVSNVFKKLTTQGVSLFQYNEGDSAIESINNAVSELTSPGVELYNVNACKVVYDSESERFSILPGTAFMTDGTTITIDTDDYDISERIKEIRKTSVDDIWVCFYRNTFNNSIDILVETEDENFNSEYSVKLGRISADNTVYDKREFAKTKLAPCSANVIQEMTLHCGTLSVDDVGRDRRRLVLTNVFPGATKVFLNGVMRDIQRIDTVDGEELIFDNTWPVSTSRRDKSAFNFTSEGLEVWAYTESGSISANSWSAIIF